MVSQVEVLHDRLHSFHDEWMEMSFANGSGFSEWWNKYFALDCHGIVRASGNPLSKEGWHQMISSDFVNYLDRERNKLVSIDSCLVFANGNAAVTTMTLDMIFDYKEIHNEDRAKVSLTWELDENEKVWKIIHFQRASGQPIPEASKNEGRIASTCNWYLK